MGRHFILIGTFALGIACLVAAACSSLDSASASPRLADVLEGQLDRCYGPIWKKHDPALFSRECVADEIVATGADSPRVWIGRDQSVELAHDLLMAYPRISANGVWTKVLGADAALQFVVFRLTPADPTAASAEAKSLYVWVRTPRGWRIVADHFGFSGMNMPE